MSEMIADIAKITALRDRQLLDISVAESLFRSLDAHSLSIWSIAGDRTARRARLTASVQSGAPVRMLDPLIGSPEWPLVDESTPMHACCQHSAVIQVPLRERAQMRSFVPVTIDRGVGAVVEVERPAPLDGSQLAQIEQLLRIHRNQIALLDYSERDNLTGLNNRKTFDSAYERRVQSRSPAGDGATPVEYVGRRRMVLPGDLPFLAVMDIDFFKRINDKFGHVFGDEVLLMTSQLMQASFRNTDALFRFGGEEFVVMLPPTDPSGAETAFDNFRQKIEQHDFPQVGKVTISVGFSAARASDAPDTVFQRADEALYFAKQNGRNRVCGYEALVASGDLKDKSLRQGEIELF